MEIFKKIICAVVVGALMVQGVLFVKEQTEQHDAEFKECLVGNTTSYCNTVYYR